MNRVTASMFVGPNSMDDSQSPEPEESGSITMLYHQWRGGDPHSLNQLITRFWPRLLALAHSTLQGRVQRAADAEDALQSAVISFWEHVDQGGFGHAMDRDDLWNVLGLFTVRKAIKLQERERALKRGGGRVVSGLPLDEIAQQSSAEDLDLVCTEMLELLDPELRTFALLRLMGHKNQEIADKFGCSERKVERKLQLVRAVWKHEMDQWQV